MAHSTTAYGTSVPATIESLQPVKLGSLSDFPVYLRRGRPPNVPRRKPYAHFRYALVTPQGKPLVRFETRHAALRFKHSLLNNPPEAALFRLIHKLAL